MDQKKLDGILASHKKWLAGDGGERANLRRANLRWADLSGADLSGADIDFAAWPLWCGSIGVTTDDRISKQLLAHALDTCRETAPISKELSDWVNECHRIVDDDDSIPKIEPNTKEENNVNQTLS